MISGDRLQIQSRHSLAGIPSVLFIASMATLVQSYVAIKIAFLALFLFAAVVNGTLQRTIRVYPRLVFFYLMVAIIGIVWAFVGLLNPGTYFIGVTDALRLYVIWSAAFLLLYTLLRSQVSLRFVHSALVIAGISISLLNFAGVLDEVWGLGIFPEGLRIELHETIGIYEGYIQITSLNIGALFFLVPYIITIQVREDSLEAKSIATKLCLLFCLILTVISGRRALLLVVAFTPCIIIAVSAISGNLGLIKLGARRLFLAYTLLSAVAVGVIAVQPKFLPELLFVQHVQDAFSAEDERAIQKPFLIAGFKTSPIIGSGFGANAGYQRSRDRPWTYELTYYQMLFNSGVLGVAILSSLLLIYSVFIAEIFRKFKRESAVPFGLFVGVISLLIGAISNPYLGSFDLLFFVGMFPFLSTFTRGFAEAESGR
jgi:hypothetical protein